MGVATTGKAPNPAAVVWDPMGDERHLDRAAVERVLRRAGEMAPAVDEPTVVPESMLVEAAAEAGIPPDVTRRAIAYERLGPRSPGRRTDRLVGPAVVVVEREVPGDSVRSIVSIDAWLVTAHHMRRDRRLADGAEWRRRTDPAGRVQRSMRSFTGEGGLGRTRAVAARAADLPGGRSVVRLAVDRRGPRAASLAAGGVIAAIGIAGAAVAVVVAPIGTVAAPIAIVAGGAVTRLGRRGAERDRHELELLADALEVEREPRLLRDELKARIRRPR